jgi:hypothetical protein
MVDVIAGNADVAGFWGRGDVIHRALLLMCLETSRGTHVGAPGDEKGKGSPRATQRIR